MCSLHNISTHNTDLNLDEVDWLLDTGGGRQHAGVQNATCGRDDLASSSVDGVGVERDVVDVEPYSTNVLLTQYSLDEERKRRRHEVREGKHGSGKWRETIKAKQLHTREREERIGRPMQLPHIVTPNSTQN